MIKVFLKSLGVKRANMIFKFFLENSSQAISSKAYAIKVRSRKERCFKKELLGIYNAQECHLVLVLLKSIVLIVIVHKTKKLLFSRKIFKKKEETNW